MSVSHLITGVEGDPDATDGITKGGSVSVDGGKDGSQLATEAKEVELTVKTVINYNNSDNIDKLKHGTDNRYTDNRDEDTRDIRQGDKGDKSLSRGIRKSSRRHDKFIKLNKMINIKLQELGE